MAVIIQSGYVPSVSDEALTHARIAHSGNWHNGASITASTTDAAYFADAPDNSLTYEKWKPTTAISTWEADFTTSRTCDYAVIGAHTLGTNACTIKIQSWNGATWDDETTATAITSDQPIFCIFASKAATKWRLNITAGAASPTVAIIKFGAALQMERPLYGEYQISYLARNTSLRSNMSESGEFLGRTKQRTSLQFSYQWRMLSRAWIDSDWKPAVLAMEDEPMIIAPIPGTYSEAVLCQTRGGIAPVSQTANGFLSASLELTGYGYE